MDGAWTCGVASVHASPLVRWLHQLMTTIAESAGRESETPSPESRSERALPTPERRRPREGESATRERVSAFIYEINHTATGHSMP